MNSNIITTMVSLGLELVNHLLKMKQEDLAKMDLPIETKSKIALLKAQKKAADKYLKLEIKDEK